MNIELILQKTIIEFLDILPILLIAIIFGRITEAYLPHKSVKKLFKNNHRGIFVASIAGMFKPGPLYVTLPLLNSLKKKGMNYGALAAYLTSELVGGPLRFLIEVGYFGWFYSIVRFIITFFMAIGTGYLFLYLEIRGLLYKKIKQITKKTEEIIETAKIRSDNLKETLIHPIYHGQHKLITKKQFLERQDYFISEMRKGKIFIYPTDTIYGIGCNALKINSVKKIRSIKKSDKIFSIIVPSGSWIKSNCIINSSIKKWLKKLPGSYTLVLKLKNNKAISNIVNNSSETIGIRMPNNWFYDIVKKSGIPFVTTSVNITGNSYLTDIHLIGDYIKLKVDYIIDGGKLNGKPSTVVDLTGFIAKIIRK